MAYCGPRGIPHSAFLSWSKADRDKALTWLARDMAACPACGTRDAEWDPKRGGSRDAYRIEFHECPGCVEKERAQEAPELKEQRGVRPVLVKNRM